MSNYAGQVPRRVELHHPPAKIIAQVIISPCLSQVKAIKAASASIQVHIRVRVESPAAAAGRELPRHPLRFSCRGRLYVDRQEHNACDDREHHRSGSSGLPPRERLQRTSRSVELSDQSRQSHPRIRRRPAQALEAGDRGAALRSSCTTRECGIPRRSGRATRLGRR